MTLCSKYTPEQFDKLISSESGVSELQSVLGLNQLVLDYLQNLSPDSQVVLRGVLEWIALEIPRLLDNSYGEVLKSQKGRDYIRRALDGLI